tara:strand:+ start:2089 stop:4488 length:2400 start_codon:yes stop_codon:yes gene_type:complete
MKNSFIIFCIISFYSSILSADNISITAKNITVEKDNQVSIFQNNVVLTTEEGEIIKSNFAKYDKKQNFIILKGNVVATDKNNNTTKTDHAEYKILEKTLISKNLTEIITNENYTILGENIILDGKNKFIRSDNKTTIIDESKNKIYLENFEYQKDENIFKSVGYIKIEDINNNSYEFSQIYIDTKKKEIIGSDSKAFLNSEEFKIDEKNNPRIFSNSVNLKEDQRIFNKSIFTLCQFRKNDKCPPWTIQASEMLHDNKKKTIYYDNAIIKVYDIPIFYIPKLSHPDPSVNRRSGFLPPTFSDGKNLGPSISVPYFFALNEDKNFTVSNRLFENQHPLFTGEYHQVFKNSNFLIDFGFTKGLKDNNKIKDTGNKDHLFSKFIKNFENKEGVEKNLTITTQKISNDKYLKLYKLKSNLVDYKLDTLENSIDFSYEDEDLFLGVNASMYETLKDDYNDKYEYILPEITLEKNIARNKSIGSLDLTSNYKVNSYDTNKVTNFLVNDLNWDYKEINFNSGIRSKILGNFKNINYEAKNIDEYKDDTTSEFYGAFGYLTDIKLIKENNESTHLLKPKFLVKYSPGSMRKESSGSRLNPTSAFTLNRLDNINNFENGLSSTLGFDYKLNKENSEFDFSVAQIINEKENKKMATKTSLDEKLSDLVGSAKFKMNDNLALDYNFSLDQNYNDINYNELGANLNFGPINFDFDYLEERKHLGNQNYFKSKVQYDNDENSLISFETKRNLITDSSEFYDLSYEYINDCLRAGLVYRREFYNDSELEPENSLMFKITLIPFGKINSPTLEQ